MTQRTAYYTFLLVASTLVATSTASAQVYSGQVVNLQGLPRLNVPVSVEVTFENGGQPFDAFDASHPDIISGRKVAYDPTTARFFLPIRTANVPPGDASVSLRFSINNQTISQVNRLSAFDTIELDVVVPDPKPIQPVRCHFCAPRRHHRRWR